MACMFYERLVLRLWVLTRFRSLLGFLPRISGSVVSVASKGAGVGGADGMHSTLRKGREGWGTRAFVDGLRRALVIRSLALVGILHAGARLVDCSLGVVVGL